MTLTLTAGTPVFEFAANADKIHLTGGRYLYATAAASQVTVQPDGLHIQLDANKIAPRPNWCTLEIDESLGRLNDWYGQTVRLVMRAHPFERVTKQMAINFTDKDGEIFQFLPFKVHEKRDENLLFCSFKVTPATVSGAPWGGGDKANGKMDFPIRLSSLNGHYESSYGYGEMVLVRMEVEPPPTAVKRTVASQEPISTDTTYPGAKPFHGAESIVIKTSPLFSGKAVLTLSTNSQASAHEGEKIRFSAETTDGILTFDCKLPYAQLFQFYRLEFAAADGGQGPWHIDQAYGMFLQSPSEAFRLDIDTGNPLHIVRAEKPSERPFITISNPAEQPLHWQTNLCFTDVFQHTFHMPFDQTVAPHETVRLPIPWPLPAKGMWFVTCTVKGDDGQETEHETRFAWLDLHERTPVVNKPKFRMGIHYHGTYYLPALVDPTIDALVAAGAKITRTDYSFMFHDIMPKPDVFDWLKADDLLKRMRAAGLALDIIISGTPRWSVDPKLLEERKGTGRHGCLPPRPGLLQRFAYEMAKHYGNEIDYYEVGNEWDLVPSKTLLHDEALRIQREAYDGIHAACPTACVTTNGWAYASSATLTDAKHHNPGMIEAFAEHPEFYDTWMIHCHGSFASYMKRLQTEFFPLREKTPLKERPWFSNESALSSFPIEELLVARTVWAKILYAWAWGSRDYIWYNLRATGWLEGSEPGYGLITAGFYPRAGYAAFSALSAIFQGLDADGRLISDVVDHLYRFKGAKDGFSGLVLAGWHWQPNSSRTVRIRTDAKRIRLADHMNNQVPGSASNGIISFELTDSPKALLLDGATFAELVP